MAPRKIDFAITTRDAITAFAKAVNCIAELEGIYNDSGYFVGGASEVVSGDLEGHDITVQDLINVSTFATNLNKFLNNAVPAKVDYMSAINKFRNMS